MTKFRFMVIPVIIILILGMTSNLNAVLADELPPSWPSSFYGEFQFADSPPIVGDYIEAYVPDVTGYVVRDAVETYPTEKLVYALSIPGDDPLTLLKDGGLEGDEITFKLDDRIVGLGTWRAGTNVRLDFHPPQANSGGPYVGVSGETVSFNASATDLLTGDTFSYAWDLDNDGEFDDALIPNPTRSFAEGVYTVAVKVTDSQGGEGTASTTVFVVTPNGLTGQIYDGTAKTVTLSGAPYGYTVTYNGSATHPTNAGSYTVVFSLYTDGTHTAFAGAVTKTMVISKADQVITVTTHAPETAAFNSSFSVAASAPGGAVTYLSGSPTICTNVGATFTMKSVPGTCVVQYDQGGGTNYNAAPRVTEDTVTPNQPPVVTDIPNQTITEGNSFSTISLDAYVSDVDNTDAEMAWTYSGNSALTVSIVNRVATITVPNADWNGAETITFKATDPGLLFDDDTAVFTVTNVNDPPVITGQVPLSTNEDTALLITLANLTVTDPDDSYPADFTLTVSNGTNYTRSGNTITPVSNFNGTLTVPVTVNDGAANSNTYNLTVTVNAVNDPPVITGQVPLSTNEDTALLITLANLTVTDPDNTYPTGFTLTVLAGTNYTFVGNTITPAANFSGTLTVPVRVNDGTANSNNYNLTVTVTAVNDPPMITGQVPLSTNEDTALALTLANLTVTDPDDSYPADFTLTVSNGTNYSRSGNTITPVSNFNGTLTVPVKVNDGTADSNTYNLTVTVTAVNDPPVITGQVPLSTNEDTAMLITLANLTVTDPDNTYPTGFTLTVLAGTNYSRSGNTITPAANYSGTLTVPVKVNDGTDDSNTYNLTVTVTAVPDAPVITEGASVSRTMSEDGFPNPFSLTLNATDVDSATLTWSIQTQAANGTATVSGTGTSKPIVYTPVANYFGPDSFVVRVSDGALTDSITVNVTITSVNDAPVAVDDAFSTPLNNPLIVTGIQLKANDTDVDNTNAQLTVTAVSNATNGTVQLSGDTVTFTPASVGAAGFDYTVSDGTDIDTGHVTVTVNPATSFVLTVSKLGPGGGTVTSNPAGISCGSDCTETYTVNTVVTLTPTAAPGSAFTGWNGACSGTGTCEVTMDAAKSVSATFMSVHSIALVPGWNLVSFHLIPASSDIAEVLESIDGKYSLVYTWDATGASAGVGNWKLYDPDVLIPQSLTALTNDLGFWINMMEADTLDVVGTPPTTTDVTLLTTAGGWNLVGYPSAGSEPLPEVLTDSGVGPTDYSLVYAYHAPEGIATAWKLYDPNAFITTLTAMEPGWGYWIKVNANSTWEVAYNTP